MKKDKRIRNEGQMENFDDSTSQHLNNLASQPLNNSTSDGVAIRVEHVSKKFCRYLKKSMRYGMHDIGRNLLRMSTKPDRLRKDEFWAVNDVSFELHRGETLGIIGPNGSGKSTILKMLNGIFMPDKGKIEINGRVGALIELGAGFHPLLTGRENIYVNGAILGMNKEEIDEKFDDIIEFADIGDFIDTPVKNYSSGMFVRLGFSTAIHCKPGIFLIDEVLSVGDFAFQNKCMSRIRTYQNNGGSAIFVSHNTAAVFSVCNRVLLLNGGHVMSIGKPSDVIEQYLASHGRVGAQRTVSLSDDADCLIVKSVELIDDHGESRDTFQYGDKLSVDIIFEALQRLERPFFILTFVKDGAIVFEVNMAIDGVEMSVKAGPGKVSCEMQSVKLTPGTYQINLAVMKELSSALGRKWFYYPRAVKTFEIDRGSFLEQVNVDQSFGRIGRITGVWVEHTWRYHNASDLSYSISTKRNLLR